MTDKNAEWLNNRVLTLKGLKSRTEQQNILVSLFDKQNRTPQDDKKFSAIVRAEKAAERASKAKQAASNLIRSEKNTEKKLVRKSRNHELFNAAGLLIMAGLVDTETGKPTIDKDELLGALIGLSNVPADHEKRIEWKKVGATKIAEQK